MTPAMAVSAAARAATEFPRLTAPSAPHTPMQAATNADARTCDQPAAVMRW